MRKWLILAAIIALLLGLWGTPAALADTAPTPGVGPAYIPCECGLVPTTVYTTDGFVTLTGYWDGGTGSRYYVVLDWQDGPADSFYTYDHSFVFTHQYTVSDKYPNYKWTALLTVINGNRAESWSTVIWRDYVVPVGIKFEAAPGGTEYTLSKRGSVVTDPIWTASIYGAVTKNDPACYLGSSPVRVRADMSGRLGIPPGGMQVKVQCQGHHAGSGAVLLPAASVQYTVYNWSDADYNTLYWSSNALPNTVTRYPLHLLFDFWVYDAGTSTWVWQNQYESGMHICYTTMGTPKPPMATPWTEVIDRATTWCPGLSDESSISDELVRDLYNATWTYDGTQTHTTVYSWTNQVLRLGEMLDSTWADCKDFGNFYACLMGSLGYAGQAYLVMGPFWTKPILGSHYSQWVSMGWNHHQFGWHASLVHDASLKVDEAAPQYPINMARDTTYKGYLYQSGTWSPCSSLTCGVQ